MSNHSVNSFVQSLEGVEDLSAPYKQIEQWAQEGHAALLYEVVRLLEEWDAVKNIPEWARSAASQNLLTVLALTPQADFVKYVSQLAVMPFALSDNMSRLPNSAISNRGRGLARRVAASAPPEVLEALFAQYQSDMIFTEYLAVLLHEMVLHGKVQTEGETFTRFQNRLEVEGHPLSRLPLRLLDTEKALPEYLPTYHTRGSSLLMPSGGSSPVSKPAVSVREGFAPTHPPISVHEETNLSAAARIASAVKNWADASNGVFEARTFSLYPALSADEVDASVLLRCPLECVKNANVSRITLHQIPVDEIVAPLFAAAANGGAYNNGLGGAYGRLMAWESLAGLSGCASNDAVSIEAYAKKCRGWWEFGAGTDWFYHVAWDMGFAALQSDGKTLAILAATDTD